MALFDRASGKPSETTSGPATWALVCLLPLGDLRAELTLTCRVGLIQMESERTLIRILEKEGDRIPEIGHRLRESMVNMSHRQIADLITRHTAHCAISAHITDQE